MFQSLYFAVSIFVLGSSAMTTTRRWEIPSTRDFVERGRTLSARATILSDGHIMAYGDLAKSQKWQSSGYLEKNGGGDYATTNINSYYTLELNDDPNSELDPGGRTPRQRVEFLNAHSPDGSKWKFTWRSYIPTTVSASDSNFFHIMQIKDASSNPLFTLDLTSRYVRFVDWSQLSANATQAPISSFLGHQIHHSMTVTYGPKGSLSYTVSDSQSGAVVLKWAKTKITVGNNGTYLKYGLYRGTYAGMPSLKAWYGDYAVTQL